MKTVWEKYESYEDIMSFNDLYKNFLDKAKTEREAVETACELAIEHGFKSLDSYETLKTGDKVYVTNRGKNICLFVMGRQPLTDGMNILGAHIDSPRLDIKQNPLYEAQGFSYLDTHYYGGIKKYQWVTIPLAIHGVIVKKDGTVVNVCVGEKEDDPVFTITDLLVHLAHEQMQKTANVVIEGENLDLLVGSVTDNGEDVKERVKSNTMKLLSDMYGIEEEDFLSAELEVVPADKARDLGFDRSMVLAYGQDDKICAWTSLFAMLNVENPTRTSCTL
ncbi:MAG: aminopeptidase, partial [Firmicutes bacterium]|nr:aminopeptidase [Bacillota bacterium]